ncbi:MAG: TonB-dependent receptor [Bacteroidaceae bacterium]|nr:TonB-dependent receptor [Bacteroidaceae bacterium]
MKRLYFAVLLMGMVQGSFGGERSVENGEDSIASLHEELNEVVVKAVKGQPNAPFAVSKIDRRELEDFAWSGRELPLLFARTPGVMAWSENGVGTGTTYMRIRGAGDSRINVTLDGVPLNSPEDQCVFWANTNSYASLLSNVQIQRGVGTSTNGDGAFGGTVAMTTKFPNTLPELQMTVSGGSYNTWNYGGNFSTGLLKNHLIIDGAYHGTHTDGFIHGTKGNSGSYYGGLTYINTKGTLKLSYKNIGNYERTGQAWNGVTAGHDNYSLNAYEGFRTYEDMYKAGLGKYNSLYEMFEGVADYTVYKDGNGNYKIHRYQMKDGSLWPRTTDNFWQNHNLLNLSWRINEHWSTTGTLHYTNGFGYYEEFRYQNNGMKKFGLPATASDGSSTKNVDYVRKKGLTQNTYGVVWNVNYKDDHWDVIGGLSLQNFEANHYGYLTYTSNDQLRADLFTDKGRYKYYDSDATKTDDQMFLKGMYHITKAWDVFADVQYRHVNFLTNGNNDKFIKQEDGSYAAHQLNISKNYDFLNPKAGFSFHKGGHNAYLSYALSHREPERNNFTDNGHYPAPRPETLHDLELGYSYTANRWYASVALYTMHYHDQFVQTGEVSDIGENLTTNIRRSYRQGIEVMAGVDVTKWFRLEANAAISHNAICDFDEVVATYDDAWNELDPTVVHYDNSTLAFSPTAIVNGFADFHIKGFEATWHTNFVSRQYLDNTANKDRSLPKYTQTNIHLGYDLKVAKKGLKHILFGVNLNNIFNRHYANSGWVYSSIVGAAYPESSRYYQIGYIPMAGFTAMGNITLKF